MAVDLKYRSARVLLVAALSALWVTGWVAGAERSKAGPVQADGSALFRLHCSSGYCHGEGAKGGGGPELRGRHYEEQQLVETIREGIPGTAMPAFGPRLSASEVSALVEYVRSLSGEVSASDNASRLAQELETQNQKTGERVLSPAAELGRQLFFDASRVDNCRTCHSFEGRGGKVGPDLSRLGEKDGESIRESIVAPSKRITRGFERVQIVTLDGSKYVGVRRDEDDTRLRFFDTSTMPPVSRSLLRSEIRTVEVLSGSVMPEQKNLGEEQVRALVAFLLHR